MKTEMANLHCEYQELKPKAETNSSFLVLQPSSGVHTVNTVGSHLKKKILPSMLLKEKQRYKIIFLFSFRVGFVKRLSRSTSSVLKI